METTSNTDPSQRIGELAMPNFVIEVVGPIGEGNGVLHSEGISDEEYFNKKINKHMVPVSPDAASCCIDGRTCSGCLDGSRTEVGPKVAGAAIITAYAGAELVDGWYSLYNVNLPPKDRLDVVGKHLESKGITIRTHCDSSAQSSGFLKGDGTSRTGCGANDNTPVILQTIQSDKTTVNNISKSLVGEAHNADNTEYRSEQLLAERHKDWRPADTLNIVTGAHDESGIEVLEGAHGEVAVIFNYSEGYTLDRDAFVADTGMQVFVIDMWYIDKLAHAMAGGPNAEAQYNKLYQAMVDFQVGTYLTLCDGSHPAVTVTS